ncbi:glycoside hydrolase family 15 protein, partial [Corallococcus exiguus]|uniref:glycoside hydrolase family 15 protein n=1 Tax=Corallococcus exiguus TaxID=83462 RepID=UPI0021539608
MAFTVRCAPRFDYAREIPQVAAIEGGVRFGGHDTALDFFSSAALETKEGCARARFTLSKGESAWFFLGASGMPCPDEAAILAQIEATTHAWRSWHALSTYTGRWREQVLRSALTLKLLTSARHGSIAAAATFSLPEAEGWERNWDYRATWIRDASFTVYA